MVLAGAARTFGAHRVRGAIGGTHVLLRCRARPCSLLGSLGPRNLWAHSLL
jgi:hypothetical protein